MSGSGPRPWGWSRALLVAALPVGTAGESTRADIEQEFREMARGGSLLRARLWHARTAVDMAAHFGWDGLRTGAGEMRSGWAAGTIAQDIRVALRQFAKAPSFTLTAVFTIALGIGATVSIFSVVDSVLLQPLPYEDAEELVAIWEWNVPRDGERNVANPGNYRAWRDASSTIREMTGVSMVQPVTLSGGERPDEVLVQYAEPGFFEVLGLSPRLGRALMSQEEGGAPYEIVLSDRYWRERFAADPGVVGEALELNGQSAVIVGVLPPEYVVFGESTDLWVSLSFDRADQTNSGRWIMVLGRLAEGGTVDAAEEELRAVAAGLEEAFPEFNSGWSVQVFSLQDEVVGDVRTMLWMLLVAVGLLLLIACSNVANLFAVRTNARAQELAIRASLGAPRGALARQLLTESLLLAVIGASLGVALAFLATGWIVDLMPSAFALPRIEGVTVDGRVMGFAAFVTVCTALLFGLVPSLSAAGGSPGRVLGAEARGPSRRSGTVRNALVVAEVGLSMILLAGAALFGRSFMALTAVDDGIEPENVVVGRVNLVSDAYDGDQPKIAFFDELLDRVAAAPGVEAVGGITFLPMDGLGAGTSYWVTDRPTPAPEDRRAADIRNVSGDWFGAMGIELLQGRPFDGTDRADAPQVVIVNRALAELYWPDESPIGKEIVVNWVDQTPWTVVGVVDDVRNAGPDTEARETIYIHYPQGTFFSWLNITLRGSSSDDGLADLLRREVARMDSGLPVGRVRVMSEVVEGSVARPRMTAALMTVFAGLATLLSAVGLYGVLAYTVSRRVREIGVRVALGAEPSRVVGLVARQGAGLALLGLVLGGVTTIAAGRFVTSLLFEVRPADPLALGAAAATLGLIALCATIIPAWRAARVAPSEALRPD